MSLEINSTFEEVSTTVIMLATGLNDYSVLNSIGRKGSELMTEVLNHFFKNNLS